MVPELDRTSSQTLDARTPIHSVNTVMNNRVALFEGDITTLDVDAIVNFGNQEMNTKPGISGEIFDAAGVGFKIRCQRAAPVEIGKVKLVEGSGRLKCRNVIHAACPEIATGTQPTSEQAPSSMPVI